MRHPFGCVPAFLGASPSCFLVSIPTEVTSVAHLKSYSSGPEILQYFKDVAEKYGLMKYVRLKHKVVGVWWQEETSEWLVKIQRGDDPEDVFEDRCHMLVNASGVLK